MSIKKQIVRGTFQNGLANYLGIVLGLIVSSILARLLSPHEFGIVALVTVFTGFFSMVSDFGLGPAIIQQKSLTKEDLDSIFSFSILISIITGGIFFGFSNLISRFYNEPNLVKIVQLLSIAVLFLGFSVVPLSLLRKKLKFKEIAYLTLVSQLVSGAVAISMAFKGFSYFAIVIKIIVDALFLLIGALWLEPMSLKFKLKAASILKILKFSTYQYAFNFINYFSRNSDNLLIGKYLGPVQLGYYEKSYSLMYLPIKNISNVINPVLQPVLSNIQENKDLVYDYYLKIVTFLAYLGIPLSIYTFLCAEDIILIVFGQNWIGSIIPFKILSLSIGIQMVTASTGPIMQALNRPEVFFYSGLTGAIIILSSILYGVLIGKNIEFLSSVLVGAFFINCIQCFYFLIQVIFQRSILTFLKLFIKPLLYGGLTFCLLYLVVLIPNVNWLVLFLIKSVCFAAILYFILKDQVAIIFSKQKVSG